MPQGALFVGWGSIVPGREKPASETLGVALQYLERLKGDGTIDEFEAVLLEPHGADLEGFVILRGDRTKLAQLRVDPDFVAIIVGVQLVHTKVRVVGAYVGAELQSLLQMWDQQEARIL